MHAYRGELDQAFEWLERAYARHDFGLTLNRGTRFSRILSATPRYKTLLRKMIGSLVLATQERFTGACPRLLD